MNKRNEEDVHVPGTNKNNNGNEEQEDMDLALVNANRSLTNDKATSSSMK